MNEKRLLERLRALDQNPDWRGRSEPKAAIASILDHLGKLLNTRQGSTLISPDFGMPDFTGISGSLDTESLFHMEETLTKVITRFEPRLDQVKVSFDPAPDKPFLIPFKLRATITAENRRIPVVFETVLNPDGHISVLE